MQTKENDIKKFRSDNKRRILWGYRYIRRYAYNMQKRLQEIYNDECIYVDCYIVRKFILIRFDFQKTEQYRSKVSIKDWLFTENPVSSEQVAMDLIGTELPELEYQCSGGTITSTWMGFGKDQIYVVKPLNSMLFKGDYAFNDFHTILGRIEQAEIEFLSRKEVKDVELV